MYKTIRFFKDRIHEKDVKDIDQIYYKYCVRVGGKRVRLVVGSRDTSASFGMKAFF